MIKTLKNKNGTKNPNQGSSKFHQSMQALYKDDKSLVKRVKNLKSPLFNRLYFKYVYILSENTFDVNRMMIDFFNRIYQNVSEKGEAHTVV